MPAREGYLVEMALQVLVLAVFLGRAYRRSDRVGPKPHRTQGRLTCAGLESFIFVEFCRHCSDDDDLANSTSSCGSGGVGANDELRCHRQVLPRALLP